MRALQFGPYVVMAVWRIGTGIDSSDTDLDSYKMKLIGNGIYYYPFDKRQDCSYSTDEVHFTDFNKEMVIHWFTGHNVSYCAAVV